MTPANFKETVGVATAFVVVVAFIGAGYFPLLLQVVTGTKPDMPGDWQAAMLSLASVALGFLVGRRPQPTQGYTQEEYDKALATQPPAPEPEKEPSP